MKETSALRLIVAALLAVAAWAAFLAGFGRFLVSTDSMPAARKPAPPVIDMRLIELEPPQAPVPSRPPAPAPALAHDVKEPGVKQRALAQPPAPAEARTIAPQPKAAEPEKALQAKTPPQPAVDSEAMVSASSADAVASRATPSQTPAAPSTQQAGGTREARLVSQPLPALPDDLREDAYRADAVARFEIHVDGSAQVELIKPTSNPRLNQILLEALHRWRFFPAMENGRPVESRQDVHVRFNVS
ncbi:MAG TPA: energy transducer TonB [Trinickia sp.]|jgi:protein TonB|nr:energy transducer TonB [Trinickia sp.]